MKFFDEWATGRALRDGTKYVVRYGLPLVGAVYLITTIVHVLGGPCLMPGSVACLFEKAP